MVPKIFTLFILFFVLISCQKKNNENIQLNTTENIDNVIITVTAPPVSEDDFINFIQLTNCTITNDYSVPNINNRIMGINDDDPPYVDIENNTLRYIWGGFQVNLRSDIPLNKKYVLIAKNNKYEFNKDLELEMIKDFDDNIFGFYQNIKFENKFWLSDNNNWQFIIKVDGEIILEEILHLNAINTLLFSSVDDDPFIINSLRYVNLFNNYTYRFKKELADIIVVYFSPDYEIYRPVLYLIPNVENAKEYIDIDISWNNEILKGIYYFGLYKLNELPTTEKTIAIFDFVGLR